MAALLPAAPHLWARAAAPPWSPQLHPTPRLDFGQLIDQGQKILQGGQSVMFEKRKL